MDLSLNATSNQWYGALSVLASDIHSRDQYNGNTRCLWCGGNDEDPSETECLQEPQRLNCGKGYLKRLWAFYASKTSKSIMALKNLIFWEAKLKFYLESVNAFSVSQKFLPLERKLSPTFNQEWKNHNRIWGRYNLYLLIMTNPQESFSNSKCGIGKKSIFYSQGIGNGILQKYTPRTEKQPQLSGKYSRMTCSQSLKIWRSLLVDLVKLEEGTTFPLSQPLFSCDL